MTIGILAVTVHPAMLVIRSLITGIGNKDGKVR
jgi:hypothetical protein